MKGLLSFAVVSAFAAAAGGAPEVPEVVFPGVTRADVADAFRVMEACRRPPDPGIGMAADYFCPGGYYGSGWWQLDLSIVLTGYKWVNEEVAERAFLNFEAVQQPDGMIPLFNGFLFVDGKRVACPRSQSSFPAAFAAGAQLARRSPDRAFAERVFRVLDRYFEWWRRARQDPGTGLFTAHFEETFPPYRGYGVTNAPSGFIPLDLNVELVGAARSLAALARRLGRPDRPYLDAADRLAAAIRARLWDPARNLYSGYLLEERAFSRQVAATTFYPLRFGIATPVQGRAMLARMTDPARFGWGSFPLTSVDRRDPTFKVVTGRYQGNPCWEGDVWMTHNFAAVSGLAEAGFPHEAGALARRTLAIFARNCAEFLNPEDGSGHGVRDYGWTAGLYVSLLFDRVFGLDYDGEGRRLTVTPMPGAAEGEISLDGLALPNGKRVRVAVSPDGRVACTVDGRTSVGRGSVSVAF